MMAIINKGDKTVAYLPVEADDNKRSLWFAIEEIGREITGNIEHGECFYDLEMWSDFVTKLDRMKELSYQYYKNNNQEEGS